MNKAVFALMLALILTGIVASLAMIGDKAKQNRARLEDFKLVCKQKGGTPVYDGQRWQCFHNPT